MTSVNRMTELAQQISEKTKIITDYLSTRGLEAASFDVEGLAEFPIPPEDEIPYNARKDLVGATKELHDIAQGPKEALRSLAWDVSNNLSLQAMWEFRVAEAVPLLGSIPYEDLTSAVEALNGGLPIGVLNLRRLIRHAMTNRIFHEPIGGYVAHTRTSRLLLEDEPLRNWVGFMSGDLQLPVANVVAAMKKWPASEAPNETGVNLAYSHEFPWFDFLQRDEALGRRYNLAMKAHGNSAGYGVEHVVSGYPWAELGKATVVDVLMTMSLQMGGNQGYVSLALAAAFPSLDFIVQDQAGMRTPATTGLVPPSLVDRVLLTTHDFFTPQPVAGAACYLFRMIFHGFADGDCVRILRALVPALRRGSRVVVNDGALPAPGSVGFAGEGERSVRTLDLFMQVTVNAHEREVEDWRVLFTRADERFRLSRAWRPEKAVMWFIEAEWMSE